MNMCFGGTYQKPQNSTRKVGKKIIAELTKSLGPTKIFGFRMPRKSVTSIGSVPRRFKNL